MTIRLICGPPGSGKTTYVKECAQRGDLIVDLDTFYQALSGLEWYDKPQPLLKYVLAARDGALDELAKSPMVDAWIIGELPMKAERDGYRARFDAEVTVLETPMVDCLLRIGEDERRSEQLGEWMPRVQSWWRRYEKDERDTVIK